MTGGGRWGRAICASNALDRPAPAAMIGGTFSARLRGPGLLCQCNIYAARYTIRFANC